ncbi:uncharacterized protein QC763_510532 [Podospora pseudopauciseta]|uniref:Helicase C-terminal domain-containing protein n=1 Tax=Podospora pseudopauciseta TaxID=2093780 RepID=A0ABR0HAV2_9PEZI|nr:hypothetical protein QC763_510532 [Podospora pseudopauciseta]
MARHEKSIVFSFWMKSLDLVENLLKKHNIAFRRVDGSRSKNDGRASLHDFRTKDVPVLLMTFGTGSMGLNDLNVARRVHILEPQWNPSVENQAIGRVSRLSQTREVTVILYVMKKSIEEVSDFKPLFECTRGDADTPSNHRPPDRHSSPPTSPDFPSAARKRAAHDFRFPQTPSHIDPAAFAMHDKDQGRIAEALGRWEEGGV